MRPRLPQLLFRALLGARLPKVEGVLVVPGPMAPVRIARDHYGIPHITAETDADAWYGLGFCQGQDRAFQIESLVRVVRGTTAALVGRETLDLDRLSRRIGFLQAGAATLRRLDERDRAGLESFARGVNEGRDLGVERTSHELTLLRADPTQVTATDLAATIALQAFALAANWDSELARLEILESDGEAALEAVDPRYPEWHAATASPEVPAGLPVDGLRAGLELLRDSIAFGGASNNWALQGDRTATGRPLVANDPHLAPVLPPHWYLAHLETPDWGLAGAVFAATPAFMSAHNGHMAWGVTAGLIDNTDLFIEEVGADGASVQRGDDFVPCEVVDEVIEVKGSKPFIERVLTTPFGPIVGPALAGRREALSMAATWLNPERATTLTDLGRAETVEDLRSQLSTFSGPSLNFVAADDSGSILWQLAGESPVRKSGRGALPLPAWIGGVGWEEAYVPFEDLPWTLNPDTGYVASANTRPSTADLPFLGVDWIEGYRLARIIEIIKSRTDWDVPLTLLAQLDTETHAWADLRDAILATPHRADVTIARALLERWDGDVATDSPAASVFVLWLTGMQRRVAEAAAPNSTEAALGKGFAPSALITHSMFAFGRTSHLVRLLRNRPSGWFNDWNREIAAALAEAEDTLRRHLGPEPDKWAWGSARPLVLKHPIGARKPMDRVFNLGPIPWSGDFTTVSQSGAPPLDPLGNPSAVPSLRMAVDVGAWDDARFSVPGGQSGNPMSPHYDDQLKPWMEGRGVALPWSHKAVTRSTTAALHLIPE